MVEETSSDFEELLFESNKIDSTGADVADSNLLAFPLDCVLVKITSNRKGF